MVPLHGSDNQFISLAQHLGAAYFQKEDDSSNRTVLNTEIITKTTSQFEKEKLISRQKADDDSHDEQKDATLDNQKPSVAYHEKMRMQVSKYETKVSYQA